jgi:hypothetical protein
MKITLSVWIQRTFLVLILTAGFGAGIFRAQVPVDTLDVPAPALEDTLTYAGVLPDSMRNFCGCESVESVKKCADCFHAAGPVLRTGYNMSFVSKTVVQGSCWGFVDAVYKKAGVTKETIFSSKQGGRYASADMLKPGDWIYHVNYAFRNVGHSAIFVCWKDKAKKQAITMSYVGMNRTVPGRLDVADLKGVYSIFRAK